MVNQSAKTFALIISAIRNLRELKGSTSREILNYLSSVYNIDSTVARRQMQTVLKRGVAYGILKKNGGYYILPTINEAKCQEIAAQEINLLDFCRRKRRQQRGCKRKRSRSRRGKKKKACKCKKKRSARSRSRRRSRGCKKRRKKRKCRCGGLGNKRDASRTKRANVEDYMSDHKSVEPTVEANDSPASECSSGTIVSEES